MKTKEEIICENVKNKARPEEVLKAEFLPHLDRGINRMRPGVKSTVAQLCEPKYWETLALVDRIQSGKIISAMVTKGELAIECVNRRKKGPRRYVHIFNPMAHSTTEEG